jgi:hypothetical protein
MGVPKWTSPASRYTIASLACHVSNTKEKGNRGHLSVAIEDAFHEPEISDGKLSSLLAVTYVLLDG